MILQLFPFNGMHFVFHALICTIIFLFKNRTRNQFQSILTFCLSFHRRNFIFRPCFPFIRSIAAVTLRIRCTHTHLVIIIIIPSFRVVIILMIDYKLSLSGFFFVLFVLYSLAWMCSCRIHRHFQRIHSPLIVHCDGFDCLVNSKILSNYFILIIHSFEREKNEFEKSKFINYLLLQIIDCDRSFLCFRPNKSIYIQTLDFHGAFNHCMIDTPYCVVGENRKHFVQIEINQSKYMS